MKILVIVPDLAPHGGTFRFLERLLDIHARQGADTVLLVPSQQCHAAVAALAAHYGAALVRSRNRVRPGTAPFLTPFLDLLFCWGTVASRKPDLIVVSTADPARVTIPCFFSVPLLYILHTIPEHRFRLLSRVYLRAGFLLNNLVMTVSKAAAAAIADTMAIPAGKIAVVYNSCSIPAAKGTQDAPVILTVGHHVSYKNPDGWLEVACRVLRVLPEATFVWLGDGEQLEATRDKVRQLRLEERILLPGYVADTPTWYRRAQVYFQPSLRENHSIAVLEAMSYALPCVAAGTGGLPETLLEAQTGFLCPPHDVAGFADRILLLLGDRVLRERLGDCGRLRAAREFSEAAQERGIGKLYDKLVRGDRR